MSRVTVVGAVPTKHGECQMGGKGFPGNSKPSPRHGAKSPLSPLLMRPQDERDREVEAWST